MSLISLAEAAITYCSYLFFHLNSIYFILYDSLMIPSWFIPQEPQIHTLQNLRKVRVESCYILVLLCEFNTGVLQLFNEMLENCKYDFSNFHLPSGAAATSCGYLFFLVTLKYSYQCSSLVALVQNLLQLFQCFLDTHVVNAFNEGCISSDHSIK